MAVFIFYMPIFYINIFYFTFAKFYVKEIRSNVLKNRSKNDE